jgi:uncharacterized Fe-S cluster-containing radical SAM superfamily protein
MSIKKNRLLEISKVKEFTTLDVKISGIGPILCGAYILYHTTCIFFPFIMIRVVNVTSYARLV